MSTNRETGLDRIERWQIVWESKVTTACGRGEPKFSSRESAEKYVEYLDKRHPDLYHWVEQWGVEKTNVALPYEGGYRCIGKGVVIPNEDTYRAGRIKALALGIPVEILDRWAALPAGTGEDPVTGALIPMQLRSRCGEPKPEEENA